MINKYIEKMLFSKEVKVKTMMSQYFTPVRLLTKKEK